MLSELITKKDLDTSLQAWNLARERALFENNASAIILQNHSALRASLLQNGHTWVQAESEFSKISEGHSQALFASLVAMDQRCSEYQQLLVKYKSQETENINVKR